MPVFIQINDIDNVAVALHPAPAGTAFGGASALEDIPQGHKMALKDIAVGEMVMKYGLPIGHATKEIRAGQWVHTHNMMTNLKGEVEYTYEPAVREMEPLEPKTFMGYRRKDGRAASRNELWIIPTVGCVNDVAKTLVRENQDLVKGSIDGLYTFTHPFGCSQTGHDHAQTRKLLAGLVKHPNAGAHLILFTTGRGTPFGAPVPTMKIATNTPLATKKANWIDFNAGVVADGVKTLDEAGADLLELVCEVASGKETCAERKGFREISIFKDGVVL